MTDPVPSKECDCCKDGFFPFCPCGCHQRAAAQRVARAVSLEEQVEHLRRENVRWENAHKILLSENERLRRPAHERESPHCSTCSCGMQLEPPGESPAEKALRDCLLLAMRNSRRQNTGGWEQIIRFCKQGGVEPSPLRSETTPDVRDLECPACGKPMSDHKGDLKPGAVLWCP